MTSPAEDLLRAAANALAEGREAANALAEGREAIDESLPLGLSIFERKVWYLRRRVFLHFATAIENTNKLIAGNFPEEIKLKARKLRQQERLEELLAVINLLGLRFVYPSEIRYILPVAPHEESFITTGPDKESTYPATWHHYHSSAIELCLAMLDDNPGSDIIFRISGVLCGLGKYQYAIAACQHFIENDPNPALSKQVAKEIEKIKVIEVESKKLCFIATAAFGDEDAKEVVELRAFRDQILMRHAWGRSFVRFYYAYSPAASRLVSSHKFLQRLTRDAFIRPLVQMMRIGFRAPKKASPSV